jgi:carbamoyltransferase
MIVLSIHDGHDAGACLIQDGKLLLYSAEERRRNIKNYPGIPEQSIAALFKRSGVQPKDVDFIALSGRIRTTVPTREKKPIYSVLGVMYSLARTQVGTAAGQWLLSRMRKREDLMKVLAGYGLGDKPLKAYDHHLTHAATAFFHRPWTDPNDKSDKALVLTMDGAGDGLCATVNVAQGYDINVIAKTPKFHSVAAWMYSAITAHLGLKPFEHEYKVMGMAPYGQADYCLPMMRGMFTCEGLEFRNHTGKIGRSLQMLYAKKLYGQRFDNISAACQQIFEELVVQWARNAMAHTNVRSICAAGGAFLNVKANKLIRELPETDKLYVYPASDDGGTPVGAAILGYIDACRAKGVEPKLDLPRHMYLGLDFNDAEMEEAIKASALPYERMAEPAEKIADLLVEGKIIARFNGREEAGPRALGNRSIMADPRDLRQIRKLNFAIKYRDFWMPFATSMLQEDAEKYIKHLTGWPYWMIEAFDTQNGADRAFIAGMHPFDLTVRPQIVNELNPGYRDIIAAFKKRTGIGAVLNTSFNLHGFPVVGTPEVAIQTLLKSELDALALGPFLVTKPGSTQPSRA